MEEQKGKGETCSCGCCSSGKGMASGCSCGCGWRGGWNGGGRMLFRVLLGLIILALVFWMGVKVGELRSELYYGFGPRYTTGYNRVMPMMQGYGSSGTAVPVPSATPTP